MVNALDLAVDSVSARAESRRRLVETVELRRQVSMLERMRTEKKQELAERTRERVEPQKRIPGLEEAS